METEYFCMPETRLLWTVRFIGVTLYCCCICWDGMGCFTSPETTPPQHSSVQVVKIYQSNVPVPVYRPTLLHHLPSAVLSLSTSEDALVPGTTLYLGLSHFAGCCFRPLASCSQSCVWQAERRHTRQSKTLQQSWNKQTKTTSTPRLLYLV